MYKNDKYVSGEYSLDRMYTATWKEKQLPEYSLGISEFIYSEHLKNKTAYTYSEQQKANMLRLYAAGNQPAEWYKTWLSGGNAPNSQGVDNFWENNRESLKKGYMNLDWDIVSVLPRLISVIMPIIKNIDFNLKVDTIDPLSGSEEEEKMIDAYKRTVWGEAIDAIYQQNGLPLPVDEGLTGTYEELEQMKIEGMFKADHALALAKLLRHTESISGWDEHVLENIILDGFTLGRKCVFEDYNYETRKSEWKYANPALCIWQYSDKRDSSDSDYCGYVDKIRITELMRIFPDVDPKEWEGLAKTLIGYEGNREPMSWGNTKVWESFYVPYLRAWWIDICKDKYIRQNSLDGREMVYKDTGVSKQQLIDKKASPFTHNLRIAMECKMVIGTKYVWDYGVMKNQARPGLRKPKLPLVTYTLPFKPLVERLIPIMNQLQISWLKYQNAMATAFPGGIAVDIGMINNIADGDKAIPFMGVIRMMFEKGFLPYKLSYTGEYKGGAVSPIQQIPSDLINKLTEYLTIISGVIKLVEEFTGLSPVSLGGTPTKDQQVGTTEMSYASTMNVLKYDVDANRIIKQGLGTISAERIRIYSKADPGTRKAYESVIGAAEMQKILDADKQLVEYGISCVARPDDETKQQLILKLDQSYQRYVSNQPGLNEGQVIRLTEMANQGVELSYIGRIMTSWIEKSRKELEKKAQQASVMQSQVIQQQDTNKAMADFELKKQDTESKIMIDNNRIQKETESKLLLQQGELKMQTKKNNSEYLKQLMQEENAGKVNNTGKV